MTLKDLKNLSDSEKRQITEINLHDLGLTKFPDEIFELINIQRIFISKNAIEEIPSKIKLLKNLSYINLGDNKLSKLPSEIKDLSSLEFLHLANNKFTTIPTEVYPIKILRTLSLSGNNIKNLPNEITGLQNLLNLFLESNNITRLTKAIAFLPKLTNIALNSNPLSSPPLEICIQGLSAIRNYLNSIDEAEETYRVFEGKLLIVGEGNVGKTCLMERLINPEVNLKSTVFSTEGIDIKRWYIKTNKFNDFQINIWDFGGQEIYHSTHQFFLTKRSLYIFVWIARTDDNILSFDYWLNVIKLLSDNAPVLVVLNKIDERVKMLDEQSIKSKFDNIVGFLKISAICGTGMQELRDAIGKEMESLPHIGDTLPKAWVDIRNKLENLGKNYISLSEYKTICNQYGLNNTQALFLSSYFHDLGVILHFQENEILNEIVFLRPDWATNAVYKVTDTKEVQLNYGKFKFSDLKKIWSTYDEENYKYLVELMKKFELCFKLRDNQYIVPELLSETKAQAFFEWNYKNNLIFEYHYAFMPSGIITRLIVRIHDMIIDSNYWKNGMIIRRVETYGNVKNKPKKTEITDALILNIPLERRVRIFITGADKTQLLGIIRREIENIHKTLNSPEFREMIPCKCKTCESSNQKNMYSYRDLRVYLESDEDSIFCTYGKVRIKIASLLDGIEKQSSSKKTINTINIKQSKVTISD